MRDRLAGFFRRRPVSRGVEPTTDPVHDVVIGSETFRVGDAPGSNAVTIIATEINVGPYDFSDIPFESGDVVLDVGAHVGMVSMWLGRRHPDLRILAFEPIPESYRRLVENIERNGIRNVEPHNLAVTSDGRDLDMVVWSELNSGGGTAAFSYRDESDEEHHRVVPSTTLDAIFVDYGLDRVKLLKIDIEGGEHEVLHSTAVLDRVDYVRGEFHENSHLKAQGHSIERVATYVRSVVGDDRVDFTPCQMAEL